MYKLAAVIIFTVLHCALCRNSLKTLTESLGQEVIEIPTPIKELLFLDVDKDLFWNHWSMPSVACNIKINKYNAAQTCQSTWRRKPSAEVDEGRAVSTTTLAAATKKEVKKTSAISVSYFFII
ncbi:hypothetical protein ACJJTC_004995 [Scirpophaga incertulas]